MSAAAVKLLEECKARGISLRPGEGGKLKVSPPPERLPEELREALRCHKQEILALLHQQEKSGVPLPDYRALYGAMTRQLPEDMPVIDAWLCDQHPTLWQKIRDIDDELSRLEREGAPEEAYKAKLTELVTLCHEAKGSGVIVCCRALVYSFRWLWSGALLFFVFISLASTSSFGRIDRVNVARYCSPFLRITHTEPRTIKAVEYVLVGDFAKDVHRLPLIPKGGNVIFGNGLLCLVSKEHSHSRLQCYDALFCVLVRLGNNLLTLLEGFAINNNLDYGRGSLPAINYPNTKRSFLSYANDRGQVLDNSHPSPLVQSGEYRGFPQQAQLVGGLFALNTRER